MVADIDRNVALVIFRFFPSPTPRIIEEANDTGIIDVVLEISKKLEGENLPIERFIGKIIRVIGREIAAQNNDEDSICKYWCDDALSLVCSNGKVWIELGRILDVEEEMIKQTTQNVYNKTQEPSLRIIYFFIDVFDKHRPHRFFIDLDDQE